MKTNIAIFASGGGSNAQEIMEYFEDHQDVNISLVVSNNPEAHVLERAKKAKIEALSFAPSDIGNGFLLKILKLKGINFVVLAGFLKKIPTDIIEAFPYAIVNIHPALLPNYGGKGMYGMNVHRAVYEAKDPESGITIHYVNNNYDEGNIIEQHKCSLDKEDSAETIQKKVLKLEHEFFAPCIEKLIKKI